MGTQGSVASLCPVHLAEERPGDPLYGYRSAFDGIVSRLEPTRVIQCLPRALSLDTKTADVPCTLLVQLPPAAGGTCNRPVCDPARGLSVPPSDVLGPYCKSLEAQYVAAHAAGPADAGGMGAGDPAKQSVCELRQLTAVNDPGDFHGGTCAAGSGDPGWCYVTGPAAGACGQAVVFAAGSPVDGVPVHLACSER